MSAHTPGPWSYGFPKINGVELRERDCQVSSGGFLVANVSHGSTYPAEPFGSDRREANARLIAAAPDLLAALEALDRYWLSAWPNGPDGGKDRVLEIAEETRVIWRQIRAALAKAAL